jgi:hypothetical protein
MVAEVEFAVEGDVGVGFDGGQIWARVAVGTVVHLYWGVVELVVLGGTR